MILHEHTVLKDGTHLVIVTPRRQQRVPERLGLTAQEDFCCPRIVLELPQDVNGAAGEL